MRSTLACLILVGLVLVGCGRHTMQPVPAKVVAPAKVAVAAQPAAEAPTPPQSAQQPRKPSEASTVLSPTSTDSPLAIFDQRILPILQAARPSSCSECHLSGVDLKDYIRPTQETTFAALVAGGLIDTEKPEDSKLLQFIARKPDRPNLVTEKARQQELEAFKAWILAAVKDPKLLAAKAGNEPIGPQLPDEVIRHARSDRVLASFIDNVWSEVGRCAACHSPDRNQKQVKEHGEQVSWIKLRDPRATLDYLLEAELINAQEPEKSLLIQKPTLQVKHGGGKKLEIGDRTYKQFRAFIDDYAAVVGSKYRTADQLPPESEEVSQVSEIWFKLEGVPERFDGQLLQVDLYRREGNGWSKERWATSDRAVFGKGKLWQHSLSITAPRGSSRGEDLRKSPRLPAGRYLCKIYVDRSGKLAKDFTAVLDEEDLVGEVEIDSRWPEGYGQMTVARFPGQ